MLELIRHKINEVEITLLETSNKCSRYLLCFEKHYYEVNRNIVDLISVLKRVDHFQEAVSILKKEYGRIYSEEEIELLVIKFIKPILEIDEKTSNPFLFKKEFISGSSIKWISNLLSILFDRKIIYLLLMISCCLEIYFFSNFFSQINVHQFDLYTFIVLLSLFLISSFIHELGHASACRYYELEHGGIGFGLYLNFPVFYTDVSSIWKLSRKKRLLVNFAGVYFQLILLIPILLIYFFTFNSSLKYFIYIINFNFLLTLNPFLKFDGYWIVSDLLGVPNLRERTTELFLYYFKRIKKDKVRKPFLFEMKIKEKVMMLLYSLTVNVFFAYYFFFVLPKFLYEFVKNFPDNFKKMVFELAAGQMPDFQLIQIVIMKFIFFVFTIYLCVRLTLKILHKYNLSKSTKS